jgi:hypothetical protein
MTRTARWLGLPAALLIAFSACGRNATAQTGPAGDPHANLAGDPHANLAGGHANLAGGAQIGDVSAGPATIRGRVVHRARPEAAANIPVALFSLAGDGRPGTRQTRTGPGGEFSFEKVANDPGTVYLIDVRYAGMPFGKRAAFGEGELEHSTRIEISDASADASELSIGEVRLRIDRGCGGLHITEVYELRNPTDFVFHVPAAERGTREPIFRTSLPASANSFAPGLGSADAGLQQQGNEVVSWGPLHPGSQEIEFAYSIPGEESIFMIQRDFPRGAEKAVVMTWANGPAARGEGLRPGADVSLGDLTYATRESGALGPGDSVAFALDLGAVSTSAERLSLSEVQMWLELDDAALDVREQFELSVSGEGPLHSGSDAPLLCLPLPPGVEGLRFSAKTLAMGIEPDATGGLALRGPFPPGKSVFALSYLLRSGTDGIRFARSFPTNLSLLSMFIADTGLLTETDRLHRRRPLRTSDRTYIHLEAFEIEPGETVEVNLTSTPSPRPLSRVATIGVVSAAAIGAIFFLAAPLRAPREQVAAATAATASTAGERESVYAAIADLEDDFETGKVSAEDHAVMLAELRAQAAELLRLERDATPPAAAPAPPACPSCGAIPQTNARFCSHCGARLGPPTTAGNPPG